MKTKLTIEESAHLIKLGIDAKLASMCMLYFAESDTSEPIPSYEVWEDCGKLLCNISDEVENVECKIVPIDSDYDQSSKEEIPIYSLADILNILPKEIEIEGEKEDLNIVMDNFGVLVGYPKFHEKHGCAFVAPELIDALNSLLIWCLENKIIKLKDS